MSDSALAVLYLAWLPLGPDPLRRFLASYGAHPAEREHRLVVIANGIGPTPDWLRSELARRSTPRSSRRAARCSTSPPTRTWPSFAPSRRCAC